MFVIRTLLVLFLAISIQQLFAIDVEASLSYSFVEEEKEEDTTRFKSKKQRERDSLKALEPIKPNLSYFFTDTIKNNDYFAWRFDHYLNEIENLPTLDTALDGYQNNYKVNKEGVGSAWTGAIGGPAIPYDYSKREPMRHFSFMQSFQPYLFTPEKVTYINGIKPFTMLEYSMMGNKLNEESQLQVLHNQNVDPSTTIHLDLESRLTKGMYNNQHTKSTQLDISASHTGQRYTVHTGYLYNNVKMQENGGIFHDGFVADTLIDLPTNIPVNLNDASSLTKSNEFYLSHSFFLPLSPFDTVENFTAINKTGLILGNYMSYKRGSRRYSGQMDTAIYDNFYFEKTKTFDSLSETAFEARLYAQLQPYRRGGYVSTATIGFGTRMNWYYNFKPSSYVVVPKAENLNEFFMYGAINGSLKEYFKWGADFVYHPFGYRANDFKVNGELDFAFYIMKQKTTLDIDVTFSTLEPDYWQQQYSSNHFIWNNNFAKETRLKINALFRIPFVGTRLGGYFENITNAVYYNDLALPTQSTKNITVSGIYIEQHFKWKGINLIGKLLFQSSSDKDIIPLSPMVLYGSAYYELALVKNVLKLQIGLDLRYYLEYYGYAYNPAALSQFHTQKESKLGNYLWGDIFIAAKWKRVRLYAMYQHGNQGLFGGDNYFDVLHYPHNRAQLKLGLSWSFYD